MKSCHSSVNLKGSDIGNYLNMYVSESVVTLANTPAAGPEREMVRRRRRVSKVWSGDVWREA